MTQNDTGWCIEWTLATLNGGHAFQDLQPQPLPFRGASAPAIGPSDGGWHSQHTRAGPQPCGEKAGRGHREIHVDIESHPVMSLQGDRGDPRSTGGHDQPATEVDKSDEDSGWTSVVKHRYQLVQCPQVVRGTDLSLQVCMLNYKPLFHDLLTGTCFEQSWGPHPIKKDNNLTEA